MENILSIFRNVLIKLIPKHNYIVSKDQDGFIAYVSLNIDEYLKTNPPKKKVKILYIPSYYMIPYPRIFDLFMALSLKSRGAEIIPVITGYFHQKQCVLFGGIHNQNRQKKLQEYYNIEKKIWINLLKTEPVYLENYRTEIDIQFANKFSRDVSFKNYKQLYFRGYPVGEKAAIVTQNMNNMPSLINDDKIINELKIHVENIIELINSYEKILELVKPDVIFSNVPFYYRWGSIYHIAKTYNIPFYSAFMAERKNSFLFQNNSDKLSDCTPAWSSFKKIQLKHETEKIIETIVKKRIQRKVSFFSPYPTPNKNNKEYKNLLTRLESNKPIVFFPVNVLFDAAVFRSSLSFSDLLEMINKVISFFNKHMEYQLIIKAHPAEKLYYKGSSNNGGEFSKYCLLNYLNSKKINMKNNIIFLNYNSTISTFDLIDIIDLGIVYSSTTTIEMAWFGKPVIAVTDSHYQKKGFTFQPKNEQDFFNLINKITSKKESKTIIKKRIESSKKYYLLYNYHACVDFHMYHGSDTNDVKDEFIFKSYKELLPGNNKALDYICEAILNQLPIFGKNRYPPPTY